MTGCGGSIRSTPPSTHTSHPHPLTGIETPHKSPQIAPTFFPPNQIHRYHIRHCSVQSFPPAGQSTISLPYSHLPWSDWDCFSFQIQQLLGSFSWFYPKSITSNFFKPLHKYYHFIPFSWLLTAILAQPFCFNRKDITHFPPLHCHALIFMQIHG